MPKNHSYVSFRDRVAAIRIDPIRRTNQKRNVPDAVNSDSLFLSCLQRWRELNLASHFTEFASQCTLMAQSLPMLLYNQSKIFNLLIFYLKSTDIQSSESLLDLLVNFARDLGEDFEPFYASGLETCISLIQKFHRSDECLEIVEQTFNCLAYLFKYLSYLLTTDLIPTYKQVLPLFGGKSDFKPRSFVLRFAAESISFLVRRCNGSSLESIVDFIVSHVANDPQNEQLTTSSSLLLATTLKGPGNSIHSKAPTLLHTFVTSCHKYKCVDLIAHVLVHILHHTRKENAGPVYEFMKLEITKLNNEFGCYCLFVLAGLRKGDRVTDWNLMYEALISLGESCSSSLSWSQAASTIIAFADLKISTKLLKKAISQCNSKTLFSVMETVSQTSPDVFKIFNSVFWTELQSKCDDSDFQLLSLLSFDLKSQNLKASQKAANLSIVHDANVQSKSAILFDLWWKSRVMPSSCSSPILSQLIDIEIVDDPVMNAFRSNVVAEFLVPGLVPEDKLLEACHLLPTPSLLDSIALCLAKGEIRNSVSFVKDFFSTVSDDIICCLSSPDSRIRRNSLKVLKLLVKDDSEFLLDQCEVINDLSLNLENVKNISHRLRLLCSKYKQSDSKLTMEKILSPAVVNFFFGMLTVRLQPICNTVLECMSGLAEKSPDLLCSIALRLIEHPESPMDSKFFVDHRENLMESEYNSAEVTQELDCHTLLSIQQSSLLNWGDSHRITAALERKAAESVKFTHYDDLRSLGLKSLCEIPKIAEKKVASTLVQYLINAENADLNSAFTDDDIANSFSFGDIVAILELFSKFNKPEKLPNFANVKQQYLHFLGSRHSPLQRLGLKCLLTIHQDEFNVLRKYKENINGLLDDKRFRDVLTSFICTGKDETGEESLHPDDRKTVMPFIVRILYGKAQNSTKRNMRHAVLSSLHFIEPEYILEFVDLANQHLLDKRILGNEMVDLSDRDIARKAQGYLTLVNDFMRHLKARAEICIGPLVIQGISSILDCSGFHGSKTLRQLVSKTLDEMVSSVPKLEIWRTIYPEILAKFIRPQLDNFAVKNLENASALMKLVLSVSAENELIALLDDDVVDAVLSCLSFDSIKDSVLMLIFKLIINLTTNGSQLRITEKAVSTTVQYLPNHMDRELSPECFASAIDAIIKIFELKSMSFGAEVVHNLASTSLKALQKPSRLVPLPVKGRVLIALSEILDREACPESIIKNAYHSLATLFRQFVDRDARTNLSTCYSIFGRRIPEFTRVGSLITELNSFDTKRLGEPDFVRRTKAFEEINEKLWSTLTEVEWKPLVLNMLFFMRDPEELALRNNGKYALMRMIESKNCPNIVNELVLPAIKKGLRDLDDKFRRLYIDLLAQCARLDVLPSLKVLLYNGDEEADFFVNINHVQVHRRRRAIQRLGKYAKELEETTIAHYLLSIVEGLTVYSGSKNSELNHLADDALHTITALLKHVSSGQFKSVARRCVQDVIKDPEPAKLRKSVRVVTAVSQSTPLGLDDFILNVLVAPLHRMLSAKSNEHENLPDRVPISVAIVYFMRSLDCSTLELQLPGKLTSLCQLLRSKVVELRDSVRQSLSRIAKILGPTYLKFIISELCGALRRGGIQNHVLGFTVHSILAELSRPHDLQLKVGDTDNSARMIFRVVMDDTFGSIGDEKDSDGYVTSAKEIKQHKSYDTAELLASWTSLSQFGQIIEPMRHFLSSKKLTSKMERKIEEVLRRLAAGIHRNPLAVTQDAVTLGYEIFKLCEDILIKRQSTAEKIDKAESLSSSLAARQAAAKESEEFFTVRLSSRDWYENDAARTKNYWTYEAQATKYAPVNLHLLQTFALETLRSVMTSTSGGSSNEKEKGLLTISNVKGIVPTLLKGLLSSYEDLNLAALKLACTALRLPIPFSDADDTIDIFGQRALHFIKTSLDTTSLICQNALKFLTMLARHKPEFKLETGAVAYVLERLQSDLEEPERQSTAISFVRSIFSRKVMLPQVYDTADTLSKVLVTNQSDHIRTNCRLAYIQFITTYPLGKTRFDRHLATLGANLRYAAPSGRLSVMETIHTLLQKVSVDQLESSFIQYFAAFVLILVTDEDTNCRQRASQLIADLLSLVETNSIKEEFIELCVKWLKNLGKNNMLVRGGLEVAIIICKDSNSIDKFGPKLISHIEDQLSETVSDILRAGQKSSNSSIDWQLLYLALDTDVTSMIELVDGVLLYPHPWVRARAARVFGAYFKSMGSINVDLQLLVRTGRLFVRQLGAPRLTSADSLQIVKNLVFIIPIWESRRATIKANAEMEDIECVDWLIHKLSTSIRTDISAADLIGSKTAAIQVLASLPSLISEAKVKEKAYDIILGLYILNDQLIRENAHEELRDLAHEVLTIYDKALGTTEYFKRYTEAKQFVISRRYDRKAKRSIDAIATPEIAAQRRMKRNGQKREARSHKKVFSMVTESYN